MPRCLGYCCVAKDVATSVPRNGALCGECVTYAAEHGHACVYCVQEPAQLVVPWMALKCPQAATAIVCYDCWELHCRRCDTCHELEFIPECPDSSISSSPSVHDSVNSVDGDA